MDSNIAVALIGAGATIAAAVISAVLIRHRSHPQPSSQQSPPASSMKDPDLDSILLRLERHRQRATFGAVAGLLGRDPLTLFNDYPRSPRTSWVVGKSTGKPTGQSGTDLHPDLLKNPHVISGSAELKTWLASHP
jgi:hypothetical protein